MSRQQELNTPLLPTERNDQKEIVILCKSENEDHAPTQDSRTPTHPESKNISKIISYTFLIFSGRAIWNQNVLPSYIFLLCSGNPEAVGLLTAVMGISQLIVSFPSGVLADRYRRDVMLRISSVIGFVAVTTTCISTMKNSFAGLAFSLGLWGCYYGITNTSISALLADSVEEGQRSHHLTTRQIAVKLGTALGPLVTLLMFTILGDSWNVRECSIVIIVGQIISVPGFILLWFISDDYIVVEDESSHGLDDTASVSESDYDSDETASEDAIYGTESDYDSFATPTTNYRAIAVLIAIADVTSGLGSGMSIRYFPIFFLDNLKMSPVLVQILYFISPLAQAGLAKLAQQGAKQIGRCQMTVACKWIGITCMVLMMSAYQIKLPNYVISVLYVLRTSFMNCTQALTKSVIMDVVPKNERAKWSALESVNMFSWSGSAFVGGLLVDAEGILFNFYITAAFQFMATLPLIYLFRESAILEKPRQR